MQSEHAKVRPTELEHLEEAEAKVTEGCGIRKYSTRRAVWEISPRSTGLCDIPPSAALGCVIAYHPELVDTVAWFQKGVESSP